MRVQLRCRAHTYRPRIPFLVIFFQTPYDLQRSASAGHAAALACLSQIDVFHILVVALVSRDGVQRAYNSSSARSSRHSSLDLLEGFSENRSEVKRIQNAKKEQEEKMSRRRESSGYSYGGSNKGHKQTSMKQGVISARLHAVGEWEYHMPLLLDGVPFWPTFLLLVLSYPAIYIS